MKKFILFLIFVLFVVTQAKAVYEQTSDLAYTPQFRLRMYGCIPINAIQSFPDGSTIIRKILGYQDNLCRYAEERYDANGYLTQKTTCSFEKDQKSQIIHAINYDFSNEAGAKKIFDSLEDDGNICKTEKYEKPNN